MLRFRLLYVILLCLSLFCSLIEGSEKIRLGDISALTFHRGQYTTARRGAPLPQLECIGGSASKHSELHPFTAQCYNRGYDGRDVQWECKAELNKNVRFGRVTVSCEGYSYPEDPFILHGSCALQYELNFKDGSQRTRPSFAFPRNFERWSRSIIFSPAVIILGLLIVAFAIWFFCLRETLREGYAPVGSDGMPRPTAPYPTDEPPSYDEAVRPPFPESPDSTTRQRPTSSSSRDYGWRSSPPYPPSSSNYYPKEHTQTSSWLSNGLAAGAGFLGGYFLGSRDRETRQHTSRRNLYPDLSSIPDDASYDQPSTTTTTVAQDDDSYVATAYSSTSRR